MKKEHIKDHLKQYSILAKRRTTINHAFASALAPTDDYSEERLNAALKVLGQSPDENLLCVYCGEGAETWDHVVGLVKDSKFSGFGHLIGNLVPCCKKCNSQKGNKDWRAFLALKIPDPEERKERGYRIEEYLRLYSEPINIAGITECISDLAKYDEIKGKIFLLMEEADDIANRIRKAVKEHQISVRK